MADDAPGWTRWRWVSALLSVPLLVWALFVEVPIYVRVPAQVVSAEGPSAVQTIRGGRLVSRNATLGAEVLAGEVLFELDGELVWLELEAIETEISSLNAEIAQIQRQEGAAESAWVAASRSLRLSRTRARAVRGPTGSAATSQPDTRESTANAETELAELHFVIQEAGLRAERDGIAAARIAREGARDVARSRAAWLEEAVEQHRVRAPVSGVLGFVTAANLGAVVGEGELLATVIPDSSGSWQVRAEAPAAEALGRLEPGAEGWMKLNAYPWIRFGTVPVRLRAVGATVTGQLVPLEAEVGESELRLQEGLTGILEVEVESLTPAMWVVRGLGDP